MKTTTQFKSKNAKFKSAIACLSFLIFNFSFLIVAFGQNVGINATGNPPDSSAGLDVDFTDRGLLIPRLTTAQRNAIVSPANSLLIYNTTTTCLEMYDTLSTTWVSIGCGCPLPGAFSSSAASSIAPTSFSANWTTSSGATTYYLDVATDAGFTAFVPGYNNLNAGNVTTYSVTGLTCNTTYYYRVRAGNSCGAGPNSGTITVITFSVPSAPTANAATSITCSSFSANWPLSTNATTYFLDVATDAGFTAFVGIYNDLNVGNVPTYSVTGLSASTTYYYRVRASNTCGTSGNSGTITVTTTACNGSQTFSTSGTFTVPGGVTSVRVLVIGGGGGGANGHQGGGGSGYVGTGTFAVTPLDNITVTVGTGGLGANPCSGCNDIIGNTAGTTSSFGGFISAAGGLTPTVINGPGGNGGSGGGGSCNAGNPGPAGGSGGSNGIACNQAAGTGQGSYTASLTIFTVNTLTAGAGGAGGTSSHSAGGGAGGILINGAGPSAGSGPQAWSGKGGAGYGAGGGGGGYDSSGPMREAGGNGANGLVYVEW